MRNIRPEMTTKLEIMLLIILLGESSIIYYQCHLSIISIYFFISLTITDLLIPKTSDPKAQ